ncbi:TetR/AcrR family transcriptional regulator [Sphingomonas sp. 22176]
MRRSSLEKAASRERIVAAAGRQFREQGIAATGLAGIMAEAGLTVGAFYAHFQSKEDLVSHALDAALDQQRSALSSDAGTNLLPRLIDAYLSPAHRDAPGQGCANAALVAEIARQPGPVREGYTAQLRTLIDQLTPVCCSANDKGARGRAIATFGMLIGCLQLARAVDDPALSDEILAAARQAAAGLASPARQNDGGPGE